MELNKIIHSDFASILGQKDVKKQLKSALLVNRNIILVGPPGIGKTTLAKNVAEDLPEITVNDCAYHCNPDTPICPSCKNSKQQKKTKIKGPNRFVRVQGSPELTAEDLIGDIDPLKALKFGPLSDKSFTPGKIFKANNKILFFDEINRCSEKLQNALLQVLEEKTATISSYDLTINTDFVFIGTMNPEETSTETLSDVFLDRFDFIYMKYPEDSITEVQILKTKGKNIALYPEKILYLTVKFVRDLRDNKDLEKVPSVRASLGLYERAQSNAILDTRKKVKWCDVEDAIYSVISHRIRLKPSVKYVKKPEDLLKEELKRFSLENTISETSDDP